MTDVDGLAATGFPVTGLEMLQAWAIGDRPMPPHAADLGLSVRSASFGSVVFRWQPPADLAHAAGAVRGGYVSLVCDEAAALAAASLGLRFRPMRTLDLHTLLLRQVVPDTGYTVRAQVSYSGAARIVAEASVEDPEGLLVARATGSFVALATDTEEDTPATAALEPPQEHRGPAHLAPGHGGEPGAHETATAVPTTPDEAPAEVARETAAVGLRPVARLHYEPVRDAERPVSDGMDLWQPASARRGARPGADHDAPGSAAAGVPDGDRGPQPEPADPWPSAVEPADGHDHGPEPRRPEPPALPALDGLPVADGLSPIDGLQGWEGLDGPTSDGTDLLRQYDRPRHARNLGAGRTAAGESPATDRAAESAGAHMPMVPSPKSVVRHSGRRATVEHLRPVDIGTRASEATPPGSR